MAIWREMGGEFFEIEALTVFAHFWPAVRGGHFVGRLEWVGLARGVPQKSLRLALLGLGGVDGVGYLAWSAWVSALCGCAWDALC